MPRLLGCDCERGYVGIGSWTLIPVRRNDVACGIRRTTAFTLLELLVVIAIIGIVLAFLIPAVMKMRETANRMSCQSNLKQLSLGVQLYHDVYLHLPVDSLQASGFNWNQGAYGAQTAAWSWMARILPYIERNDLYGDGGIPVKTLYGSREAAATTVKLFLCPSDTAIGKGPRNDAADLGISLPPGAVPPPFMAAGQTNYKGVSGANWMWGDDRWHNPGTNGQADGLDFGDGTFYRCDYKRLLRLTDILDGTSNTFMIGEDIPEQNLWCSWPYANNAVGTCAIAPNARRMDGAQYAPDDWENTYGFRSRHSGGLQFAYADGSVHFVGDTIELSVYRALATIRGGERVTAP